MCCVGPDGQIQGERGVVQSADGRTVHRSDDAVGRSGGSLLPLFGVAVVLLEDQLVELAVTVFVLGQDGIGADVLINLVGPCTRGGPQTNQIAGFDRARLADARGVSHRTLPLKGVVADVVARQGDTDRCTGTIGTAHTHAQRGRNDDGFNAVGGQRLDGHIRCSADRAVVHLGQHIAQNHVHGRSTRSADAHTCCAAKTSSHRGSPGLDVDGGIGGGHQVQLATGIQFSPFEACQHHRVDHVASQRNTHRHGHTGCTRQSRGNGGSTSMGADVGIVIGKDMGVAHDDAARTRAHHDVLCVHPGVHTHANLVLRPYARAAGGHAAGTSGCHGSRTRNHQRFNGLLGTGVQLQIAQGGDIGVNQQGTGGGDGLFAHRTKALLTNQVTGH